ncbi:MAG: type IV secretion system DNA-binding domain-containing protein [Candidatus Liptonbacteria bacterium]|nr:type IV secretion system DNA-binding domain-containing protein [Candidatus Liptonbacteria bacterium]
MNIIVNFLIGVLLGAALVAGAFLIFRRLRRQALWRSLSMVLLLIRIPRDTHKNQEAPQEEKGFKAEINKSEQLLANLSGYGRSFVLEVAVPHVGEEIHFYLSVPRNFVEIATKQVQGLWNAASVQVVPDDYNIFNSSGAAAGAYLTQEKSKALPIRTYQEIGADTFASILGAFAKINEVGEGAALQILVQPAGKKWKKKIHSNILTLKRGKKAKDVLERTIWTILKEALMPKKVTEEKEERVVDEDAVKALEAKIAKPLFLVNVRFMASAGSAFQANDILDGILAGMTQLTAPLRNDFIISKVRNAHNLATQFSFRIFDRAKEMVLNAEELASFWHLPISSTETPRIKWLKAKESPPPDNLPKEGTLLGASSFRGQEKSIFITDEDRRRHLYVIGQTGTGKTTLINSMAMDDIRRGKGVAVIDPHGDFTEALISHIPKERAEDVIYFNPGDLERPLGINMLEYNFDKPEEKTFIINEFIGIFDKLYDLKQTGGPMFEYYLRNALQLMMEDLPNEEATLMEVPRIFTDTDYRNRKLDRIEETAPEVFDFWEKQASKAGGDVSLANMTPYVASKFATFITNDYMRLIIGQTKSAFNFRQVMDEGKILLVNLSKGRIGDINAGLLGMIFTGKLLMAALSRVDTPSEKERRDFYLYIDEFQNFTTDSISTILSEARKYRLNLTIAHQFIGQLTEKIRDSVFGNVGSMIVGRVGVQDAEFLGKQFDPVFSQQDLTNIDNLNGYVRLLISGLTSRPFNMKFSTASWAPGDKEMAQKLKEYCRLKYGQDRETVNYEIVRRLRE